LKMWKPALVFLPAGQFARRTLPALGRTRS
jgi:hypothetical protein